MAQKVSGDIIFGTMVIPSTQIFLLRKNVFGMINHRPFREGHVLVCSRREVPKLQDLTEIESLDLFMTAQEVTKKLQQKYGTRFQVTMQNGKDAGQTVPHVHFHILPVGAVGEVGLERKELAVRTEESMATEADIYRNCFEQSNH